MVMRLITQYQGMSNVKPRYVKRQTKVCQTSNQGMCLNVVIISYTIHSIHKKKK